MSCKTVSSAGWEEEEWAALKASKPSKLISIKALSKSLLPWGERREGAEKKTFPARKKQVAIVIVGMILSMFTIIYRSQAHFSLSQPWEVSITISSILQMFQNIKLRLRNVKNRAAGPVGHSSLILRLRDWERL